MKKILLPAFVITLAGVMVFVSCKKDITGDSNRPPIANAGPDQSITLPINTVSLNAGSSIDADDNIISYAWTKISGPGPAIAIANAKQTQVGSLVLGIYHFELTVTDAGGLFSKDTLQVRVNAAAAVPIVACGDSNRVLLNARLIPVGTLSQARSWVSIASEGNKLLVAGGFIPPGTHSSRVDIYDLTTQTWSTAELSEARSGPAAIGAGSKIFFAGGEISDGTCATKTVDIYDVSTNKWSASSLSIPGSQVAPAAVGNKVLFGGGDGGLCGAWARTTTVDIYDLTTNNWATAQLSGIKRGGHAAVTINNKVYFSGGETWPGSLVPGTWYTSNTVDVYDNTTNAWSTSSLTEGKLGHAGVAVNDKIFWAGGQTGAYPSVTGSCSVEVRNVNTGSVSIQKLFQPGYRTGVVKDNQIIFYAGTDKFDVYNLTADSWSIGVLPVKLSGTSIISVNNTIYLAGGEMNGVLSDKVWKLEF